MPIFEYKCTDCGQSFEMIVASESGIPKCRHCGSSSVEKQLSSFAVSMSNPQPQARPEGCAGCPSAQQGTCQMRH